MPTKTKCELCCGEGWVCENHREVPWNEGNPTCCGGAGAPCVCNRADPPWAFKGEEPDTETDLKLN